MKSFDNRPIGDIINLISIDASRIENSIVHLAYVVTGPIQLVFVVIFIIIQIDYTFLSGLILLAVVLPIKIVLSKIQEKFM
jgi:hypothetical protein